LSDFQYELNAITAAMTSAISVPVVPLPTNEPTATPTNSVITTKPKSKKNVRRLFAAIKSFMG
jgi:hypothetical protein